MSRLPMLLVLLVALSGCSSDGGGGDGGDLGDIKSGDGSGGDPGAGRDAAGASGSDDPCLARSNVAPPSGIRYADISCEGSGGGFSSASVDGCAAYARRVGGVIATTDSGSATLVLKLPDGTILGTATASPSTTGRQLSASEMGMHDAYVIELSRDSAWSGSLRADLRCEN